MSEQLAKEGPFTDGDGNQCLGVWANEGGVLLVLQRKRNEISFHAMATVGTHHDGPASIAAFRYQRIVDFIEGSGDE